RREEDGGGERGEKQRGGVASRKNEDKCFFKRVLFSVWREAEYAAAGYPTSPRRPFPFPVSSLAISGTWDYRFVTRIITSVIALFFSGLLKMCFDTTTRF